MRGSIMQAGAAAALTIATGAGVVAFVPDAMARHHAGPLAPRDECDAIPGLGQLQAQLKRAAQLRDTEQLLMLVDEDVKLDFGGGSGHAELRDRLTARATSGTGRVPDVTRLTRDAGLDPEQAQAAAAVAGTDLLVVVEGAAGAGKTTMLGAAIEAATDHGRATRVVTPTKKAADVAAQELGVSADSVAKLVHAHGWRWNADGVWTRLAVGDTDIGLRHQLRDARGALLDGLHLIVQHVDLPAAQQLAQDGFLDHAVVALLDEGLHRQAARRWRGDDGQVADAAHRHVQRARNRRGSQGQDVDLGAQALEALLLGDAEAVLLIDDQQPHVGQLQRFGEQLVSADHDIGLAVPDALERGFLALAAGETRQQGNLHRGVGEAIAEVVVVLLGEQGGGHQHRHLGLVFHCHEGGAHGHFGLAEAHIAAHQPIHGLAGLHVGNHRGNGGLLVRGFLEGEAGAEGGVIGLRVGKGIAFAGGATGIDVEQFSGDITHLFGGLAFSLFLLSSFASCEFVGRQFRRLHRSAGLFEFLFFFLFSEQTS